MCSRHDYFLCFTKLGLKKNNYKWGSSQMNNKSGCFAQCWFLKHWLYHWERWTFWNYLYWELILDLTFLEVQIWMAKMVKILRQFDEIFWCNFDVAFVSHRVSLPSVDVSLIVKVGALFTVACNQTSQNKSP